MSEKQLDCGCKQGYYLCETAEALWKVSNALYRAGLHTLSAAYRDKYNKHFVVNDTERTDDDEQFDGRQEGNAPMV